jgi:hypothetical protein
VIVLGIIGLIVDVLPKIAIVWTLGTIALVFGAALALAGRGSRPPTAPLVSGRPRRGLTGEVPETSRETGTRFADAACGRKVWLPAEEGDQLVAGAGRAGQPNQVGEQPGPSARDDQQRGDGSTTAPGPVGPAPGRRTRQNVPALDG